MTPAGRPRRIVVMTGDPEGERLASHLGDGVEELLRKPFELGAIDRLTDEG